MAEKLKTITPPDFKWGSYGLTVQVEPAGMGNIKGDKFGQFFNPAKEYPHTYVGEKTYSIKAVPNEGNNFSHWQVSTQIAKGQFETYTAINSEIMLTILRNSKATNVFVVAFFNKLGNITQPNVNVFVQPTVQPVIQPTVTTDCSCTTGACSCKTELLIKVNNAINELNNIKTLVEKL